MNLTQQWRRADKGEAYVEDDDAQELFVQQRNYLESKYSYCAWYTTYT